MASNQKARSRPELWKTAAALIWAIGFLCVFFAQPLPNNPTHSRSDIWQLSTEILNPLDYSDDHSNSEGWHNIGQRLPLFATAGLLLLVAWGTGRALSRRLAGIVTLQPAERVVIDVGGGLSLLSLWTLLCGVAGQLTIFAIALPSLLLVGALWPRRVSPTDVSQSPLPPMPAERSRFNFWILLTIPFVLHILLGATTPSAEFDVREYHLQGPKEWFQAGRVVFLDHNVYTSFPFLSEMLSLAALVLRRDWWSGALAGKAVLASFQFLSAIAAWAICRRWFGSMAAAIAAIALLSTPWTTRISVIAYAEGATSFYTVASAMMALLAIQATGAAQRSFCIIAGLLAGSAMAAKYPGLFSAVIPVGFGVVATAFFEPSQVSSLRQRSASSIRAALFFALGTTIAVGPWLVRNAVVTGNPVYPLAWSVFGGEYWNAEMDLKWKGGHSPAEHELSRIPQHILDMAVRNDWQNGLLFAFAIPTMWLTVRYRPVRFLGGHALWILIVWWALTHRIDRFWVPIIPLLATLVGAAWQFSHSRTWRVVLLGAMVVCCAWNYGFTRSRFIGFHGGLEDLTKLKQEAVRSDFALLNSTLPDSARVLMVGEAEVFDAEFDLVYNTVFDESIFEQWTTAAGQGSVPRRQRQMKSADDLRKTLVENRITHILVNWQAILRYRLTYGYTDYVFPQRFELLVEYGLLEEPIVMVPGDWTRLSHQQQQEILSWSGNHTSQTEQGVWNRIELYRVTSIDEDSP